LQDSFGSLRFFKYVQICRFLVFGWTLSHQCWLLVLFIPTSTNFRLKEMLLDSDGPSNFHSSPEVSV
jgi:hypothetical protein